MAMGQGGTYWDVMRIIEHVGGLLTNAWKKRSAGTSSGDNNDDSSESSSR